MPENALKITLALKNRLAEIHPERAGEFEKYLSQIAVAREFLKLGISFRNGKACYLGFGVLEVYAESSKVGIVAGVAGALAREGISIRYILAEDPEISVESKMTVVTNSKIPGKVVEEILEVDIKEIIVS